MQHDDDATSGDAGALEPTELSDRPLSPQRKTPDTVPGVPGFHPADLDSASGRDSLIGVTLGNLTVVRLLGRGGFGKVYHAHDEALGRDVAVKLLHDPMDYARRTLFEREGKALAALSKHPNIVEIYQWGEHEGQCYFVLEFVGGNVESLLEEHPDGLPLALALRIMAESCEAVGAAHEAGILHRDLKPANILLEPGTQQAKVADFGLARFRDGVNFTIAGGISGSPPYMSPEQATGGELDERSDVFSLGVTFYELLSGARPFEAGSAVELLERIRLNQRTPLRERRPDLPDGILAIVEKATAHDPNKRHRNASELARDLRIALRHLEREGRVPLPAAEPAALVETPSRQFPAMTAAVIAVVAVVAAGAIGFAFWGGRAEVAREASIPGATAPVAGAFSEAQQLMNSGDFVEAATRYEAALEQEPANDMARFGLGLAQLKLGALDKARQALSGIHDPVLRDAGVAHLAYAEKGAESREALSSLAGASESPDVAFLLAKIDALEGRYEAVAERLNRLDAEDLPFPWQTIEALRLLGQAYYRLDQFPEARAVFRETMSRGDSPVDAAYLARIDRKLAQEEQAAVRESAARIRAQIDAGAGQPASFDAWTSRPLTFFILPAEQANSRYAVESGLGEVLGMMLGDTLDTDTPMNLVDRERINEVLVEQELSAQLSSGAGQLALGRVLGARIIIQPRFTRLGSRETLTLNAQDVETTERCPVDKVEIAASTAPEDVIARASTQIWSAMKKAYPLRARLYRNEGQAVVNIGATAGLGRGMRFDVLRDPADAPMDGAEAEVRDTPGAERTVVALTGIDTSALPDSPERGWYVQVRASADGPESQSDEA